ncbi:MAG: hypothetical protein JWP09_99 [Candidatus Taylorbacteria bacterium]|nr:hypothetical protein [Candidatus Taylorbacteria bacterium]
MNKQNIKFTLFIFLFIFSTFLITKNVNAFTIDTGAVPISGSSQWPSNFTATLSSSTGIQYQMSRNIRIGSPSIKLLYVNNEPYSITFQASVRKSFAGTPEMVLFNGSSTVTMPAYSATTSDALSFAVNAGDIIYDRSFFATPPNGTLSSSIISSTYNPEGISTSGSVNGANMLQGYVNTSSSRLLETSKTFEKDLPLASLSQFVFSAYAVVGVPVGTTTRFTTIVGDSKSVFASNDKSSASGVNWVTNGMKYVTGAPYQNLAVSGDTLQGFLLNTSSALLRQSLLAFGGDVVNHYGTNSVDNAADPATAATIELGYVNQLRNLLTGDQRLFQATLDPAATKSSSSSWATITPADQSPAGDNHNGIATALYLSNLLRTVKYSYIDGVIDLASATVDSNGYWKANMTSDGIHQNGNANTLQGAVFSSVWPVPNLVLAASSVTSSVSTSTATVTWSTNASSSSFVRYGLNSNYATGTTTEIDTSSRVTSHSVTLTGLTPSTTYHFQTNSKQYSESGPLYLRLNQATSSDMTFTTSALPAPVISSIATSTTQTAATITWTTDQNASSTVNYGASSSYGTASTSDTLTMSHTIILTGLSAGTTYHFQVGGGNNVGTVSVSGDMVLVTSSLPAVPSVVSTDNASSIGTSTATLNATIIADGNASSTIRGFNMGLTTSYDTTTTENGTFGLGSYSASVTSLTPNTLYHYRAYSTNSAGTSYGSDATFTTSALPVPVISSIATSTTQTTATITWTTDQNASSTVNYGASSSYGTASTSDTLTMSHTISLAGLSPNTVYHYQVAGSNNFGIFSSSNDSTFTTVALAAVKPTLTTDSASSVATSSVVLNGTITVDGNAASTVRGFNIGLTSSYGATTTQSGTFGLGSYSASVTSLTPNTLYHYRAYSTNSAGTSYGPDATVTTLSLSVDTTVPAVTMNYPTYGVTLSGTIIASSTPTDNIGVAGVTFYVDDVQVGSEITSAPYSVSVDTTALTNETHSIRAQVRDTSNNTAYSIYEIFTVSNVGPTPTLISATSTNTTAVITWHTTTAASSLVQYGATSSYVLTSSESDTVSKVQNHSVTISGLNACTLYHYAVSGTTATLTTVSSSDYTFYTTGCTGSSSVTSSTEQSVTTSGGASFTQDDISVTVPSNFTATSSSAVFQALKLDSALFFNTTPVPAGKASAGTSVFNLKAVLDDNSLLTTFNQPISVTLAYEDSDIANLQPSSLWIYRYDGSTWTALSNCSIDTNAKTVTCTTTHFSDFALFGSATSNVSNNVSVSSSGGSSVGGIVYACKDPNATNYTFFGASNPSLCTYSAPVANSSTTVAAQPITTFAQNLNSGITNADVKKLQIFLNSHGFSVALTGVGSIGHETTFFGPATKLAIQKFQLKYGVVKSSKESGYGSFGPKTRSKMNELSK